MKSKIELLELLKDEISNYEDEIKKIKPDNEYYNYLIGDVSVIVAYMVGKILAENLVWSNNYWADDSLISKINLDFNLMELNGVLIWGEENSNQQWANPFKLKIYSKNVSTDLIYLNYGDLNVINRVSYEKFKRNKSMFIDCDWKIKLESIIEH